MTRALITQLVNALAAQHEDRTAYSSSKRRATATCGSFTTNSLQELIESGYMQGIGKETSAALTAAREYLATEPSGERAELLSRLAKQWAELDPADPYRADIGKAVDMLEADAQQATPPLVSFAWVVLDEDGIPAYCAQSRQLCNDHINEAISEHDIEEARKWVICEAYKKQGEKP